MESLLYEKYQVDEFTVACEVPVYWSDASLWSDAATLSETTTIRGIFSDPYIHVQLGRAGQDSSAPVIRFLTSQVPGAREGDFVTVSCEELQADGSIEIIPVTFRVGTPMPDGFGETECTLYEG